MKITYTRILFFVFFIWNSTHVYSQENENAPCFSEHKIRYRKSYHLFGTQDSTSALWLLGDRDEYDKQGRQICWRQYEFRDSSKYSDRVFDYSTFDATKRSGKKMLDSIGIDKNGYVNYRMAHKLSKGMTLETLLNIEISDKSKPIKISFLDKHSTVQAYMVFFYNDKNNITEERLCFPNDTIIEARFYSYHTNGTIKEIKKIKGTHTDEIKIFSSTGLLVEEIHYNEERENEISYKTLRTYNSTGAEIENITYTMVIGVLRPSRREVSEYDGCLKSRTIIYSIDSFSGEETLYTIITYTYEYFK